MARRVATRPVSLTQSALELFSERGFDEVTIDDISTHAGVTKGSFYSHYKSKHEIILAACSHYYRSYQQRVHAEIAPVAEPIDRLRRALELSVHTCIIDNRSRVFTTEVFALSLRDNAVRKSWAQFYDSVREMYVGLVLAAQAQKQLSVREPRAAVDLMLAAIEGVKLRATFEPHIADSTEQARIVQGLIGILASGGVPSPTAALISP